jgi:hypothetical protein
MDKEVSVENQHVEVKLFEDTNDGGEEHGITAVQEESIGNKNCVDKSHYSFRHLSLYDLVSKFSLISCAHLHDAAQTVYHL